MQESNSKKKYNLEERLSIFGEEIIVLCKETPKNLITIPIINADCVWQKMAYVRYNSSSKKENN